MAEDQLRPAPDTGDDALAPYEATPTGLVWHKPTRDGSIPTPLTNFIAQIVSDVAEDDGAEVHHILEIEARLGERVTRLQVSGVQFLTMHWALEHLGAQSIVYPGFGLADHARAAIQFLSTNVVTKRVYTHTGWCRIDGIMAYLHAGGALGPEGPVVGVQVRLSETLARFDLPTPPTGDARVEAIRASLRVTKVGPDRVTLPLYAAMARAAMATADFSGHISGTTGVGKTAVAALLQQHFGARMDSDNLPAFWSSTGNALEGLAFYTKDALFVVDDFAPTGSQGDVQRFHRDADRVLRAQGNRSGRQRMRPDGSLRPTKPPRGLLLSTGEDVPRGQSLRARLLVLEMGKRDLDWDRMTDCQTDAHNGLYAEALAGFVQWLARRYDQVQKDLKTEMTRRRQSARGSATTHRRIPTIVANLMVGLDYWLQYAQDAGALTDGEADHLWDRARIAFDEAAKAQRQHQEASEPTQRFLELLIAAIASGQAHIASMEGTEPLDWEAWGWRTFEVGVGGSPRSDYRPQGARIGWMDGDDVYLEPEASYQAAQRLARDGGEPITVGSKTLHKRLHEKGLLASTEPERHKLTIRRTVERQRRAVLHLTTALFSQPEGPNRPKA
jgi:hypothetical protein